MSPLGRFHFVGLVILTLVNTMMVFSENRLTRVYLLIAVVVLQHVVLLFFMLDYESLGRKQWSKRERSLRLKLDEVSH